MNFPMRDAGCKIQDAGHKKQATKPRSILYPASYIAHRLFGLALLLCAVSAAALGGEVGAPVEVAPKVKDTQMQLWPRAAWAADSKTWLVVWREGYINEEATDVWAARVSADGKALDPAGVKICAAKDRQERACVASDGRSWLVVWEDFRNAKDYDVYAARVSADGKVLDPEGFLVAGGEHNQCYPTVAFAGGNYAVVWMAFVGEPPDGTVKDGVTSGYRVCGTAVSPEGKVMTANGAVLPSHPNLLHVLRPAATAAGEGRVLVAFNACENKRTQWNNIGTLWVDGATGKASGAFWEPPSAHKGKFPDQLAGSPLAASWGRGGGLILALANRGIQAWRVESSGARVLNPLGGAPTEPGFSPWFSIACDGEQHLIVREVLASSPKSSPTAVLSVQARLLPADWKGDGNLGDGFFPVAGDGKASCLMGQAAAGPKGSFLVTYAEARGVDDVKVLARIVK